MNSETNESESIPLRRKARTARIAPFCTEKLAFYKPDLMVKTHVDGSGVIDGLMTLVVTESHALRLRLAKRPEILGTVHDDDFPISGH
jgi:hypothetical protein